MSLTNDLNAIKTVQDGVKNNKVTRFAYTQTAYDNNDVNGHDDYVATRDNNIPLSDLNVIEVNPTVVDKGFRARASALNRMFLNHLFGRISYNLNKVNDLFNDLLVKIVANLGVADGLATLDSTGRIPYSQLPEDAMEYQGDWDASTNTPALVDGTGTKGDTYNVSVAGTQTFGGVSVHFFVGDRIIYNGSVWQRASSGNVQSVSEVLPDPATANVDLSQQTDVTKIFNSNFTIKLLEGLYPSAWKDTNINIRSIAYGNGVYIACLASHVYKSTNGRDFTEIASLAVSMDYSGVEYANGKFILTARAASGVKVWRSTDNGDTWTDITISDLSTASPSGVLYVNGLWQLITNNGLWWSEDTSTWTKATSGTCYTVSFANNIWVLGNGTGLLWSENGKSWSSGASTGSAFQIAYGNGVFVASTNRGMHWSTDGKTWTAPTSLSSQMSGVAFGNGMFIAGAYSGGKLYSSTDGKTWTERAQLVNSAVLSVFFEKGYWYVVFAGYNYIYFSADGSTWKPVIRRTYQIAGSINSYRGRLCAITSEHWNIAGFYTGLPEALEYLDGE